MRKVTLLFLLSFLSFSCAKKSLVALVPDPEGRIGSISVQNEAGSVTMDTPYSATTIGERREAPSRPVLMGKEKLEKIFAAPLAIEPQRPRHFLLYFREDTTLRGESLKRLPEIIVTIEERHSGYISVIGHCDTLGTVDYNVEVAEKRALRVKELMVESGVEAKSIVTSWRGERELLVPTPDETFERGNRAVEVVVR